MKLLKNQTGVASRVLVMGFVAVIVVGAVGYYLTRDNGKPAIDTNNSNQSEQSQTSENNSFDALPTSGTSFTAEITTTSSSGTTVQAVMKYDKDTGNISYSSSDNGKEFNMVYTNDAYYMCQGSNSCIKYPLNGIGDNSFNPDSYEYTDAEIEGFRNTAVDGGEQDCLSGRCRVWKVTEAGYESSIYLDTKTRRITQVEGKNAGGSSKIVYTYGDVSVVPPTNVREIPSFNQ